MLAAACTVFILTFCTFYGITIVKRTKDEPQYDGDVTSNMYIRGLVYHNFADFLVKSFLIFSPQLLVVSVLFDVIFPEGAFLFLLFTRQGRRDAVTHY